VGLEYAAPGGKAGAAFAKMLGADPAKRIAEDLGTFKSMLESGAVAHGR
jgi:uncharacterized membrane protein